MPPRLCDLLENYMAKKRDYALAGKTADRRIEAPAVDYLPRDPRRYSPGIGLIGCGGITESHLRAYRAAGYRVVALCNRTEIKAKERQVESYPNAKSYWGYRHVVKPDRIELFGIPRHPHGGPKI